MRHITQLLDMHQLLPQGKQATLSCGSLTDTAVDQLFLHPPTHVAFP